MTQSYSIPNVVSHSPRGDRIMDVYSHLLAERIIYLGTPVDPGVANAIIAQLLYLDSVTTDTDINVYINCSGGDPSAMLAIYDTMQFVRSGIATTCVGQAVGVGAVLLAAGTPGRRMALPHTRVILHQPSNEERRGTIPDLILQAGEAVRIRADLENVLSRHSGQPAKKLRRDTDHDRVFTATEARDYGLLDHVIEQQ